MASHTARDACVRRSAPSKQLSSAARALVSQRSAPPFSTIRTPRHFRSAKLAYRRVQKGTRIEASSKQSNETEESGTEEKNFGQKLGDSIASMLGPIAMSFQGKEVLQTEDPKLEDEDKKNGFSAVELGPIGMTFGGEGPATTTSENELEAATENVSIASMTTEEWRQKYESDDGVDLWLEDDFNRASRLAVERPNVFWSGEESYESTAPVHTVTVTNAVTGEVHTVTSPQDRYILFEAEEQGLELPQACRMGCCSQCTVKIKSGTMHQPQGLGLSAGLKEQGYGLLCVGMATSDLEVELQDPEEAYLIQFGDVFAQRATDKNAPSVERDDFALELADMDE